MEEETRKFVVDTCREAYKRQHDGELKYYKDLAIHIKHTLDKSAKVVLLIFSSGKIVLTGAKKREEIHEAYTKII